MIDEERRLCHMRNHTLVHLINACLKKLLPVVCPRSAKFDQVSSTITTAIFSARFGLDGNMIYYSFIFAFIRYEIQFIPLSSSSSSSVRVVGLFSVISIFATVLFIFPEIGFILINRLRLI